MTRCDLKQTKSIVNKTPGLLVSVRNAAEAEVAVDAGANWIDVKEPNRGALGRADISTIREVIECVAERRPVSAALGELERLPTDKAVEFAKLDGLSLVKIGLAGMADDADWAARWLRIVERLRDSASVAAVVYADWQHAGAPSPHDVLAQAAGRCSAVLIDTFDKRGPSTPEILSPNSLSHLVDTAKQADLLTVIAGRLRHESLPAVLPSQPDYVGVRGAVCGGMRSESIRGESILQLRTAIHATLA